MALSDCRGVPVSTGNRVSLDHFEKSLELLNGYFVDPLEKIDTALAADPDFIMGHCIRGGMHAVASEKAAEPGLRESVEAAEALAGNANDRERGHIAALRAWLDGDFRAATDGWGAVAVDYPRDLLALQMAHLGDFYLGRSSMLRDRIGRALPHWDESVPGFGYVLGMRAFGLEEMNEFDRAEDTGRHAVELNPRDPWAIHAVAHVLEMTGKLDGGVDWMTERTDDWAPDNMFAFHNWWHLSLYHLDRGETARVLEIYDTGVRPEASDVALEMLDASSLLWRLHLDGIDVGNRWAELVDMWEGTMADGYYAFNDVHAMMTADVGLPLARAIQAFGQGDYATTVDLILPVAEIAHRFGGSNAQRDVVHRTLVEAAIRAGRGNLARALVAERLSQKPDSLFNKTNMKRAEALAA